MFDEGQTEAGFGDDPLLTFEYLNPEGRKLLRDRFAAHAVPEKLAFQWRATPSPCNRVALVNRLTWGRPDACYLEIGCDNNALFDAIPLAQKVGVDPEKGGNIRMTSDDFFASNELAFDVIFIDGLHTYQQVRRDVSNAIKALSPGGWIALHDMVPRNWEEEHVPRLSGPWTGNVWKVAVELAQSRGVDFRIVMIDQGVGLMRLTGAAEPELADLQPELADAGLTTFLERLPEITQLSWDEAITWIDQIESGGSKGAAP